MSDFFIHNGDSFLPEYLPGILGYGQNGAPGNQGMSAPSIYYSSYNFSLSSELKAAKKKILNKQQLSNNLTIKNDNDYQVNDIIIDNTGTFYKITNLTKISVDIIKCANNLEESFSDITKGFIGFNIKCTTSFLKSSDRKWVHDNPNYNSYIKRLQYSPKIYHHNHLEQFVYGNYITFNLIPLNEKIVSKYSYKFVLVLPNGQTFDFYTDNNVCTIFLENKLLFGCFSTNEWKNLMEFNLNYLKDTNISELITNNDLAIEHIDNSLGEFTKIDPLKYVDIELSERINNPNLTTDNKWNIENYFYHNSSILKQFDYYKNGNIFANFNIIEEDEEEEDIENENEESETSYKKTDAVYLSSPSINQKNDLYTFIGNYDHLEKYLQPKEITILLSYFIKYECTAYCEITNKSTGKVYRVDINDIFINNNQLSTTSNIKEVSNYLSWNTKLLKYDIHTNINNFLTYNEEKMINGEKVTLTKRFNPMNSFVILEDTEDITAQSNKTISEDGIIENLYFIDADGFSSLLEANWNVSVRNGEYESTYFAMQQNGGYPAGITFSGNTEEDHAVINQICEKWNVSCKDDSNTNIRTFYDSNKIIRLSFSSLSKIKVNIQYLKNTIESLPLYSQAMIYIGYIDHPLIVLPNTVNSNKESEDPGIYYLTKIVPPGYYINDNESDYTKTSTAGMTESTIELSNFGISDNDIHYIEIGVTLLNTENNSREAINAMHRPSYSTNGDETRLYTFLDNKNAGTPDIRIFVSGVYEKSEKDVTNDILTTNFNNFNSIHCDKPKDIEL